MGSFLNQPARGVKAKDLGRRREPGYRLALVTPWPYRLFALLGTIASAVAADSPSSTTTPPVDFVAEIQPLFARRCLECHGPQKQKSGYRLDAREIARRGGESGHLAIVPGKSAESPLLRWVLGTADDQRMPPKGEPLTTAETQLLRRWIDEGAVWPDAANAVVADPLDWWSLKPLARPTVPAPQHPEGVRNPIDAFVRARLDTEGLAASPEADRHTQIRRVTLDLTGLPPTPEEVAAFVADADPAAYDRLVSRLLDSPAYGERWARTWLDIVHYGDTQGYDKDKPRPNAWPYRDYVIRAFNADKPYARFVQEQLAGDALFPDTADGIEALGFISAGPWDFIGHEEVPDTKIDGKIARHLDRDDMVSNTIGTFASLTVHCAQCHAHKFDPIPQEDYYRLQAVFAAVDRADKRYYDDPSLNRQRRELETELRQVRLRQRELGDAQTRAGGDELKSLDERISKAEQAARDAQPEEYGYHGQIAASPDLAQWVQVDLGSNAALRRVVLRPARDAFNNIGDGFGFPPRFKLESAESPDFTNGVTLLADRTAEDVANPGIRPQEFDVNVAAARYVRLTATRLAPRQNDFILALAELEVLDERGTNLARGTTVTALDSIEGPPRWAKKNLTDGKFPGSPPTGENGETLRRQREELLVAKVPAETRSALATASQRLTEIEKALKALPEAKVAFVGAVHDGRGNFRGTGPDGGRPRPIHMLMRGDVTKPGREVNPGTLSCVHGLPATFDLPADRPESARRAALAQWLTDPANPLTWRSIVNRVWQQRFGRGLVETPNDFGRMGGKPSHPELLDWLAVEFREGGQSFKALDRLIVTSSTYRQISHPSTTAEPTATAAKRDADNRWLWRMNARRLEAEAVRDSILAVSGKLDRKMYGPGFQDFVVEKPEHSPHYQYHLHDPENPQTQRRSVYRFLVRSQQEPFMTALDCADPSMRVDRRNETLTPLQALALLNSKLTVAMARHFAARVEREAGANAGASARVERAFTLATQRPPTDAERRDLASYAEHYGLPAACRVLLNLNEFVFVD